MSDVTAETEQSEEMDYTYANDKAPTSLQARFADWLQSDAVGYDPESAESKTEAFKEGVRYAVALRMPYQASAHNKTATAADRKSRQDSKEEWAQQKAAAREEKARLAAAAAASAAAPAPAAPTAPAPEAPAAPAAPTAPTAPATKPAVRRSPARKATSGTNPAPF